MGPADVGAPLSNRTECLRAGTLTPSPKQWAGREHGGREKNKDEISGSSTGGKEERRKEERNE
eukprot:3207284-Rhodomonas_salina.2